MKVDMNNVVVKHKGHTISIAQHEVGGKAVVQEILVWGPNVKDEIISFGSNGPWLVSALQEAIDLIDAAMEKV